MLSTGMGTALGGVSWGCPGSGWSEALALLPMSCGRYRLVGALPFLHKTPFSRHTGHPASGPRVTQLSSVCLDRSKVPKIPGEEPFRLGSYCK